MENVEYIGLVAACLTTGAFIPQAIKVIRTGETKALSFWMYFFSTIGVALWLIYGFLVGNKPLIASNVILLPLLIIIFVIKVRKDLL